MKIGFYLGVLAFWLSTSGFAEQIYSERLAELQGRLAQDSTNTALLFEIADLCYDEGAEGNAKAVELAESYFNRLLKLEPNHALGMALLGSTITMKGRDAFWPNVRLRHAKEGVRIMDAAVKLAPDDPRVRLVRAENNFHMPKFMDREDVVKADFEWLWQQAQKKPEALPTRFRQKVAYFYGLVLKKQKRTPEAIQVWQSGLQPDPNSERADQIRKQLK
jgi:tetratricopeptide (TPR) repeat protein